MHFPLHPETPPGGIELEALFAGRDLDLDAMYARMKALMDAEGLPYSPRTHSYNSRLAQELGKWAETQPQGDVIHDALFRAYFVDTLNIGEIDVLVDIADSVGLPAAAARDVLEQRSFRAAVDADWTRSQQYGITGVPTFVANGYGVVGAQSYETLEHLIRRAAELPPRN